MLKRHHCLQFNIKPPLAIAILDINISGMDGLEVLEKVFAQKPKTKVILREKR